MRQLHRNLACTVGVVCLAWIAVACGESGESEPDLSTDRQELTLWLQGMPATLDPSMVSFTGELSLSAQLFRGLLWYDEDLELAPLAATDVPTEDNGGISNDGLVYTFKLREDLKWSDGQPITAEDFEYGIKRVIDPRTQSPFASIWFNITGAERAATTDLSSEAESIEALLEEVGVNAADAGTLVVTLNSPQASFLHEMVHPQAMPVRKDLVELHGQAWAEPNNLVANGPFVVAEMTEDRIVLKPNSNWWMEGPRLETVTFKVIPDPNEAFSQYLAGGLDYVGLPPIPEVLAVVDGDPAMKDESHSLTRLTSVALVFNNTKAPFDNDLVRKAFALAVDRAAVIERFQPGGVNVGYAWIPEGMPGHDEKLGEEWAFDGERAREMLAEAGYPNGAGLPTVTFAHPEGQAALAGALKEHIELNLGVEIELEVISAEESRNRFLSGDYQIVSSGWTASVPEASSVLPDSFGCQRYEGDVCTQFANTNRAYYANPEFDRIISLANKELDDKRRLELYKEAHEIMVDDVPAIFLGTLVRRYLVKSYVEELIALPIDQEFAGSYFLERTYIHGRNESD